MRRVNRRYVTKLEGLGRKRYCGIGSGRSHRLTWHATDRNGLMYRCTCMRLFRLPDGRLGPNAAILKRVGALDRNRGNKQFAMWKRQS